MSELRKGPSLPGIFFILVFSLCLAAMPARALAASPLTPIYQLLLLDDSNGSPYTPPPVVEPQDTYYVSATNPLASDANPGTQNLPLKTIGEAVSRAQAGYTILIGSGDYRETVTLTRDGAAGAPITLQAISPGTARIKGSDEVTGWSLAYDNIWVKNGWKVNSQQLFCDGVPLQQIGISNPFHTIYYGGNAFLPPVGSGLADMYAGSFYYDQSGGNLYAWLPDGSSPANHLMEASVRNYVIFPMERSYITLNGLTFSHSNISSLGIYGGMVNAMGDHWTINGCTISYGDFAGLVLSGDNHEVKNNFFLSNGDVGVTVSGSDAAHGWETYDGRPPQNISLVKNETNTNNYRNFDSSWQAGGLKAATSCNGLSLIEHTALNNNGQGVWFDVLCKNVTVERSYFRGNIAGVAVEISDEAAVTNNLFEDNAYGVLVSSSSDTQVQFNTFAGNDNGVVVINSNRTEHPETANVVVKNNLHDSNNSLDVGLLVQNFIMSNVSSNYNAYAHNSNEVLNIWTDSGGSIQATNSLTTFRSSTGQDFNSVLVAPDGGQGLTATTASVVDSADSDPTVVTDFYGNPRPQGGGPDIGAVEH